MTLTRYTHPEQLDKGIFYNGILREEEKLALMKKQYQVVLEKITDFISKNTQ